MPRILPRSSEQSGLALVLESEALAIDADDDRVVQDPIEHRGGKHSIAGESSVPTAEGEIRGEDHRAAFIQRRTRDGFLGSFFRLCLRNSAHSRCAGGKVAPSAAPFAVRFIPAGPRLSPRMRRTSPRFSNRRAARLMSTKLVPSSSRRRRRRWRCNKSARPPGAFPLLARCQVARNMNR